MWAKVEAPVDNIPTTVEQVWYSSKDGTPVPMFILAPQGMRRDGRNPTVITGYGGWRVSLSPRFSYGANFWLRRGGVYVVANLRGGGEFGEDWHHAAMLEHKQNGFDDFIAAAEYLIDAGYTTAARLAALGYSNGGLTVGAALTQRPTLFRAAVCGGALFDMLRYHHFGQGQLWTEEYGCAELAAQFAYLYAYSPYHRVQPDTCYPAVLLTVGANDDLVDPLHSRKMAAVLQQASTSALPVLLRVGADAGHGAVPSAPAQLHELVDVWSFICTQLILTAKINQQSALRYI